MKECRILKRKQVEKKKKGKAKKKGDKETTTIVAGHDDMIMFCDDVI